MTTAVTACPARRGRNRMPAGCAGDNVSGARTADSVHVSTPSSWSMRFLRLMQLMRLMKIVQLVR